MKKLFFMITMLIVSFVSAQQLDTIYANEKKAVALFFPKPIRQGIVGKQHFVFNYNREEAQHLGLLQATPGVESNLLAITNDGQVYSYILKYADKLSTLNYFIKVSESIGAEKPLLKVDVEPSKQVKSKHASSFLEAYRTDYVKKYAEFLLKRPGVLLKSKRKKGMILRIHKLVYNRSEMYLYLEIENRSEIDFEIDYLNIYRLNGNPKRRASFQRLQLDRVYAHKMPKLIKHQNVIRFVYVLPKFVLGKDEKLQIELKESKGSRNLSMTTRL